MVERAAWPRIVPFAIYMAFIAVADLLARLGWQAQELRSLYTIKIALVLLALLVYRRRYSELSQARLSLRVAAISVAVGLAVLVLWINLDADWMVVGSSAGFDPRHEGVIDWSLVAVRIFGAALVVPVMEELFWRSFLMRWVQSANFLELDPAHVKITFFVVTVILFGVEHNLWFAGVVAGVAYSLLYMRYRTLWAPVLAHAVTNGVLGGWVLMTAQWNYW